MPWQLNVGNLLPLGQLLKTAAGQQRGERSFEMIRAYLHSSSPHTSAMPCVDSEIAFSVKHGRFSNSACDLNQLLHHVGLLTFRFIGTSTDWAVWNNPETQEWTNASAAVQIPEGKLASLSMPLTQVISHRAPVKATALASGNIRFDFAENFVGVTALNTSLLLKAFGLENGSQLVNFTAQHCELVNSSTGAVNCDLTGDAGGPNGQRDNYTAVSANSEPGVQLLPRWTWHGFQFVEVAVSNGFATPSSVAQTNNILDAVTGLELRTNIEQTGSVTFDSVGGTGDHILNDIQTLVLNSQRSNVAAYQPTDCPTREKHGWLGDAQVTAEEAMLNFDMASVYTSFLETIRNNQQTAPSKRKGDVPGVVPTPGLGAGWGSGLEAGPDGITDISWSAAYPLITRWMLQFYGDERVVADHYPNLVRFMDNLHTHAQANSTTEGLVRGWVFVFLLIPTHQLQCPGLICCLFHVGYFHFSMIVHCSA